MEQKQKVEKQPMIQIDDLYKAYGPKEVLKGLTLDVYEGELFGFIGRNGIGKSTTIDCMIGAKKFNKGRIVLDNLTFCFDEEDEPHVHNCYFYEIDDRNHYGTCACGSCR